MRNVKAQELKANIELRIKSLEEAIAYRKQGIKAKDRPEQKLQLRYIIDDCKAITKYFNQLTDEVREPLWTD